MRTARRILLGILLATAWVSPAAAADGYPKVYNKYLSHVVESHQWAELAKWDVLVLDAGFEESNPGGLATLRSLNPDIILLGFMPINGTKSAGNTLPVGAVNWKKWQGINDNDFWLYDTQGNIVSDWPEKWSCNLTPNSPVDAQGRQYWEWLAHFIYDEMWVNGPGWDGIFLDDTWEDIAWLNDFIPDPIDSDEDGAADPDAQLNAWWRQSNEDCTNLLRSLLGPDVIIVSNGHNTYHGALNGSQLEDFPTHGSPDQGNPYGYAWNKWMFTTLGSYTMGDNYNAVPQQLMMINGGWTEGTVDDPDTTDARFYAHLRFLLGSTLLKDGYFCLNRFYDHNTIWWRPEYETYLGDPLGPFYTEVVDGKTVYVRDYQAASVAVNPNNAAVVGEYGFPSIDGWDAYIGPPITFTPPPDTTPPAVVWAYSGYVVDSQSFVVKWQAVGDDGQVGLADHYEVRVSENTMYTEPDWQAGWVFPQSITPLSAGSLQELLVDGLQPETKYYVCVRAVDDAGNMGALPSWHPDYTTLPTAAGDTLAPAAIEDLALVNVDGLNIEFSWDAPGDDGDVGVAQSYDARWSRNPLTEGTWSSATAIAGLPAPVGGNAPQSAVLQGVNAEDSLYVGIRAQDDAGNVGPLSNVLGVQADVFPAEPVTDLAPVDSTESTLTLTFTAPVNPGGGVAGYYLRYLEGDVFDAGDWGSGVIVSSVPPETPGSTVTAVISGLQTDTQYAVRVRTLDGELRLSDVSNLVVARTAADSPPPPPPPPPPTDTKGPHVIDDLAVAEQTTVSMLFSFSAPDDDSSTVVAYDARYVAGTVFGDVAWDTADQVPCDAPQSPGTPEEVELTGLAPESWYTLRIKSRDEAGNWSELSPAVSGQTEAEPPPPPPPPADTTGPAVVDDLTLSAAGTQYLTFGFTAPADAEGTVADYDARYVTGQSFPESSWDAASPAPSGTPKAPGQSESLSLTGLNEGTWYTVRVMSADDAGNWSGLSPAVSGRTGTTPPPPPPPVGDVTGPAAVTDLVVAASTETTLTLQFTAPADEEGVVTEYDLRYRNSALFSEQYWFGALRFDAEPAPATPGEPQTMTVSGLDPDADYSFRLKSKDDSDNWSDLSNLALGATDTVYVPPPPPPPPPPVDTEGPAAVSDLAVIASTETTLTVQFTAPQDAEGETVSYDVRWVAGTAFGPEDWDGATTQELPAGEPGTLQETQVGSLPPGTSFAFTLKSVDDSGNWSDLSNVALGATDTVYVPPPPPPPPPPADTWPPEPVDDLLVASATETSLVLTFSAPLDEGGTVAGYDLRYIESESFPESLWEEGTSVDIDPSPANPVARPSGSTGLLESATAQGLAPGTTYAFRIKAVDDSGNWSDLSAVTLGETDTVYVPPPPPPPPADTTGPGAVTDLTVLFSSQTMLAVRFTAPEDDQNDVTAYDVRVVEGPVFTDHQWDGARKLPAPVGYTSVTATGLRPSQTYSFRMRAVDAAGNWSELSNVATGTTVYVPPPPPPPQVDIWPPEAVGDLAAQADDSGAVALSWTAPADAGNGQTVAAYTLRWAYGALDSAAWAEAGPIPTGTPLEPGSTETLEAALWELPAEGSLVLAFALTSVDSSGNESALSNVAAVELRAPEPPPDTQPPSVVVNLSAQVEAAEVVLRWDPVPDADLDHYRVYRRGPEDTDFGLYRSDLKVLECIDDQVAPGREYAYLVTAVDAAGNESAHSLSVAALIPDPYGDLPPGLFTAGPPRPNPVQDQMQLSLELGSETRVLVDIVDVQGRRVHREALTLPRGEHIWTWNRASQSGGRAPAGMYWLRIQSNGQVLSRKVLLLP